MERGRERSYRRRLVAAADAAAGVHGLLGAGAFWDEVTRRNVAVEGGGGASSSEVALGLHQRHAQHQQQRTQQRRRHNAAELSEYEKQRQARIEANQDMLRQLGLA